MAISHNLSDVSLITTGYDPVNGISGTVGNSWLLWKIFTAWQAFDNTIQIISGSAPTPDFLQQVSSSLVSEPAQTRAVVSDHINFYFSDDPGLSQTIPFCTVYKWVITTTGYGNVGVLRVGVVISGSSVYKLDTDVTYQLADSPHSGAIYGNGGTSGTQTNLSLIPKVLFLKSSNVRLLMGVDRNSGAARGGIAIFTPAWSGINSAGPITSSSICAAITLNNANGHSIIEGHTQLWGANINSLPSGLSPLSSIGSDSTGLVNTYLVAGKLRFGINNTNVLKAISDEIEGVLLCSPNINTAYTINIYNSKHYVSYGTISDGRENHRIMFQLD